jgi:hypothetical protein
MVAASKLKALVDQQASGPSAAELGMAMPPHAEEEGEYDDDDDAPEAMDPAARGAELIAEWGEFGATLKDEAGEIHDLAVDIGGDLLLKEVPDDALKGVGKAVDGMPDELSMGFAKYVSALSPEDCDALATALASGIGDKADQGLLCAFITHAGKYAGEEIEVDEDFNVSEEEEEETEEDAEPEGGQTDPALQGKQLEGKQLEGKQIGQGKQFQAGDIDE